MNENAIEKAVALIANSRQTTVVTGAGISTEAGIPDFRGKDGIYTKLGENYVMGIININSFRSNPEAFYRFYRQHFVFPPTKPGKAHLMLAKMEEKGWIKGVVTQNVDGLHEKAGSKTVISIHGTADRFVCQKPGCEALYDNDYFMEYEGIVPYCEKCGTVLKPDAVLFGENIKNYIGAWEMITEAQVVLVIGSSLTVYPLSGFVKEYRDKRQDLIIINKGPTQMDYAAAVKIDGGHTGDTLEEIVSRLELRTR